MSEQSKKDKKNTNKIPDKKPKINKSQSITFWIVALLLIAVLFQFSSLGNVELKKISYTQFEQLSRNNEISEAVDSIS